MANFQADNIRVIGVVESTPGVMEIPVATDLNCRAQFNNQSN